MEDINKVMIIDDKETFIFPLEIGLKRKGIDVISFTNPEEAIEYLKHNTIHVLLTDYHMEPNINGDEVIRRVREFNKDIIIYLQTGYAETLPADEMLEKYDIQGYIDKGEGQEKNIQLVKASLKQAELLETIKQQKVQIGKLEYSNQFFGKFLGTVLGQIKEEGAVIGPLSGFMADDSEISIEERKRYSEQINNAIGKLCDMARTMEIKNLGEIYVSRLSEILNNLLDIQLQVNYAKLNFKYNEDVTLRCDAQILIYILVEIIEALIENEKEIIFTIDNTDMTKIVIEHSISNNELVEKIKKLAEMDEKIEILINTNTIEILIK